MKKFFGLGRKKKCPEKTDTPEAPSAEQQVMPDDTQPAQASPKVLVGAIDFGTTYSGWAFSFLQEFKSDPTKASVKVWHSGTGTLATEKAPTCILIEPDGKTAVAFGYDAENKYRELIDTDENKSYYFFRRFKMTLHKKLGERIDRTITLEDEMGKSLRALDVFAIIIEYLIKDMLQDVNKRLAGIIQESEIHWVLTVPAIWTDGAKQFMREAAEKAGIDVSNLTFALEPEAASIYCRHLSVETTVDGSDVSVSKFKTGTRYMILDAGGGTIDITVHEVGDNGMKEVHAATGGDWGGTMVDKDFEDWLLKVFSREVYDRFKSEFTEDWQDFWRDFEIKKRSITHNKTPARVNLRFPLSLKEVYTSINGDSISDSLSSYRDQLTLQGDKMKFSAECFRSFFTNSVQNIISHVKDVLKECNVEAILMVGGYSESPILQHAVQTAFPDKDIVLPREASSTILRGALIFGHSPRSISERVLKYTYGIEICMPFKEGKHPESKRVVYDGDSKCIGIFDKLVEKNQAVKVGKAQARKMYNPTAINQSVIPIRFFASNILDPQYVDQDCFAVGELTVEISDPDDDLSRELFISLSFSGTEIVVEAEDKKAERKFVTSINFLG
ncbi:heat shock 70 kDa protein 12A-like [Mercenaria mercenaria]|uniref:heat shock 70 kDa protein 12A-like n=1 Tax=Mercenaria mercenaria TaxID=6596 RepID=UPI00234E8F3A|nr:heat shock 70 kDa protein 12A-like [Mercenaria mercenaria]